MKSFMMLEDRCLGCFCLGMWLHLPAPLQSGLIFSTQPGPRRPFRRSDRLFSHSQMCHVSAQRLAGLEACNLLVMWAWLWMRLSASVYRRGVPEAFFQTVFLLTDAVMGSCCSAAMWLSSGSVKTDDFIWGHASLQNALDLRLLPPGHCLYESEDRSS